MAIGACIFHSNWAEAGGYGTLYIWFGIINITNTLFENNSRSVVISQEQHSVDNQPTFSRLTNCTVLTNNQLESKFPADLFVSASVILMQVSVMKTSSLQNATSILTTADAVIKSLVLNIEAGEIQYVATLNKVKWEASECNLSEIFLCMPQVPATQNFYHCENPRWSECCQACVSIVFNGLLPMKLIITV